LRVVSREQGFSLLELLFVLVVLVILMTIAFTSYRDVVNQRRVQNVTRELAADVRVAQQAAVAKSAEARCVGVSFRPTEAAVYVVPIENTAVDCGNPDATQLEKNGLLLKSHEYPLSVTVWITPGETTGVLAFLPSGAPCTGPACARQLHVTGGGHQRYVCFAPGSGLVTVQDTVCP
jgi:prepilin-type N-terminal cleavage/methylation domain-containing protein